MNELLIVGVAGAVGGLLKSLVEQKGAVALPRIEVSQDGTKYIHLGFIANLIVGASVALLSALYSPITALSALFAGVSSAFLAEKFLEKAKDSSISLVKK